MSKRIQKGYIRDLMGRAGTKAEGCRNVLAFVREGLRLNSEDSKKGFSADNFSYLHLAYEMGVIDPYSDFHSQFNSMLYHAVDSEMFSPESYLIEANPGLLPNAFQTVTAELIGSKVIEGYNSIDDLIGDKLITVMAGQTMRNQKLAGFTHLSGPTIVEKGHPYPETGFEDKYVVTHEDKKGIILSLSEELLREDQTGEINRLAMMLGVGAVQEREKTIVQGVVDYNSAGTKFVYRPSGVSERLYATDGSNQNYIGSGGVSGYNAAVPLTDFDDVNTVLVYRATQVKDDRVDGTQETITGLNSSANILLVPESLSQTGFHIKNQVESRIINGANETLVKGNSVQSRIKEVLSSPHLDVYSVADWYYGNFKKQFIWTDHAPIGVTTQGKDSNASFENDTTLRVRVKYIGGLTALDTPYVTKIDGV